jgi:pyrroloquinoline quinone biosynthesis protein B
MRAIVLGSAAGGGVPQWNCRCLICSLAWAGDRRVRPRTQSSIAVSPDGENWLLINASPDLRQQLTATPVLYPKEGLRHSPIRSVVLTNADVDHIAGLLTLRESQALELFATDETLRALGGNPVFNVLSEQFVSRRVLRLEERAEVLERLSVTLFAVPGKVPLWREAGQPAIGNETESTVGVLVGAGGREMAYIPGCAAVTEILRARLAGVDVLLFDGTVFEDDDLIRAGVGTKTGWRMGHVSMAGGDGSMAGLSDLKARRIFVHINNTNPVLVEGSAERRTAEDAGWEIAYDGMVIDL